MTVGDFDDRREEERRINITHLSDISNTIILSEKQKVYITQKTNKKIVC